MTDSKKIAELETRVQRITEQQIAILEKLEKIMTLFAAAMEKKNNDVHMICSCGQEMMRIENKYPLNSEYWECEKCGNTYIPMK